MMLGPRRFISINWFAGVGHAKGRLRPARRFDSHGSIIIGALVTVFVLSLLGVALFDLAVVENRLILGSDCDVRAFYAAEAGLQVAYKNVNTWFPNVTSSTYQYLPGSYNGFYLSATNTYSVQGMRTGAAQPTITLIATGSSTNCGGAGQAWVQADVVQTGGGGGVGSHTVPFVGLSNMNFNGLGALDSFDSSQGSYAATKCQIATAPFTCGLNLWTNGLIDSSASGGRIRIYANITAAAGQFSVGGGAVVYGSVTYDPADGSVFCHGPSDCSQIKGGVTTQSLDSRTAPPVTDCRTAPGGGYSSLSYVRSRITPTTAYTYDPGTGVFNANANITINPGGSAANFCFSGIFMNAKNLTIPSTVTNEVVINIGSTNSGGTDTQAILNGQLINNTGKAQYLRLLTNSTGANAMQVTGGVNAYVFAYAPNGTVVVRSGSLYGSALGNILSAQGGADLHFDKALWQVASLPGVGAEGTPTYALQNWKICRNATCT